MTNEEKLPAKLDDLEVLLVCKKCGMTHYAAGYKEGFPGQCVHCHAYVEVKDHYQMGNCSESILTLVQALDTAKGAPEALRKALNAAIAATDEVKLPFELRLESKQRASGE
jgi:hypothetical protein